jgi:serine protease Do
LKRVCLYSRVLAFLAILVIISACTAPGSGRSKLGPASAAGGIPGTIVGSYAGIVEKAIPSVVYVYAEIPSDSGPVLSAGSGVILRPDGYILTNKHVVNGTTHAEVTLENRTTYPVAGVWVDDQMDLAVLKIEARDLTAMPFADPRTIRTGDWVIALGHALGISPLEGGLSVTGGVVSNLGRSFVISGVQHYDVIQTDAAINPGNSGGPLVNLSGELVGINSAGAVDVQNIGFAINVGSARHVFEDLATYGKSHHPYLGIMAIDVTQDVAKRIGCACNDGALISEVEAYGPCAAAGLKRDDMIASFGGDRVYYTADLLKYLWRHDVGDRVEIVYHRAGEVKTVIVTLGERGRSPAI